MNVTIPNSVTSIGYCVFENCSALTSITIPNSITSIDNSAFRGCSGLAKIEVEEGNPYFDSRENCNAIIRTSNNELIIGCKNTYIHDSVKRIGDHAFYGCSGLTNITIPNSVTIIGDHAFSGCKCIIYAKGTTPPNASYDSFSENMIAIVPSDAVDKYRRAYGWAVMPINLPFIVNGTTQTTITLITFDALTDVYATLGDEEYVPQDNTLRITGLVPNSTYTINVFGKYKIGEKTPTSTDGGPTGDPVPVYISLDGTITVTTSDISMSISLIENTNVKQTIRGSYSAGDASIKAYGFEGYEGQNEITIEGLIPGKAYNYTYYIVTSDGSKFTKTSSLSTRAITVNTNAVDIGATHCELEGDFSVIDATVTGYGFTDEPNKKNMKVTGLDPYKTYTKTFYVETEEGGVVTRDVKFTTTGLELVTSQAKVISLGNVIVAAESNLDDAETNVGFEWRRTDWTDDFASNTGTAYLYNGTIEGYIRNLNTDKLWKYRPYYLSNSGTYYYGDWVGLDPTNTSYFEPTVHTYEQIEIEGNTALVKGYALTGTDGVAVQGFKYWKTVGAQNVSGVNKAATVPSDAITVTASGQVMTANLTELDYNSTYHYAAFVTTSTGETFYGEELAFSTGADPAGIYGIAAENKETKRTARQGVYNFMGVKVADDISDLHSLPRGVYIVNGKKMIVK